MRVTAYHLDPRGPMHFGDRTGGVESTGDTCRADTLFSALCFAVLETQGAGRLEAMLADFRAGRPPFILTSAFPRVGDIRLIPRPRLIRPLRDGTESSSHDRLAPRSAKILKKVRYFSWDIACRSIGGGDIVPPDGGSSETVGGAGDPDGGFSIWFSSAEQRRLALSGTGNGPDGGLWRRRGPSLERIEPWWHSGGASRVPRVLVDRVTGASTLFHSARLVFRQGSGLHVIFRWHDETWRPAVEGALKFLGDTGIGGERAVGHGQFTIGSIEDVDIPVPAEANGFVTLSPYCPTLSEIGHHLADGVLGPGASWELGIHGGWIGVPGVALRQSTVTMVSEGSSLCLPVDADPSSAIFGQLHDVTPRPRELVPHPIYRYGYAFPWPAVLHVDDVEEIP